ncbi:hypothetical protein DFH11DRAFT_1687126 [Phellopilus nigrolimitatus]|nr:hypothetical protein DFH11DRAFT_1687126 [Phellopilus nigrolimitatus]
MNRNNSQTASPLETLAPELISRIAIYAVANDEFSFGPPSAVTRLALTSRSIYHSLSLNNNSPLLSEIFRLKFDYAAIARRVGSQNLTTIHFAIELKKRCRSLQRIRAACVDDETLVEDLWTIFLMMLENDGLNERHLLGWANLPAFLYEFLHSAQRKGTLCEEAWWEETPELSLAIWITWLTSSRDVLRRESKVDREILILQSIIARTPPYVSDSSTYPRIPIHFTAPKMSHIIHFGQTLNLCTPPSTAVAFLAMAIRLDFDQQVTATALGVGGPTMEDMAELASATRVRPWLGIATSDTEHLSIPAHKTTSILHDLDWYRITSCHDYSRLNLRRLPFNSRTFVPGQLSGLWAGKFMVPELQAYRTLLASSPGTLQNRIPMYQRPLYMRLREHHCFLTDEPIVCGGDCGETDDFLNVWLPKRCSCIESQDNAHIDVDDPMTRRKIKYMTFHPGSNPEKPTYPGLDATKSKSIKTDPRHGEAWGHFKIIGRVRLWDGLVVLQRKPANPDEAELGTWVFRGYVISSGTLVGRWRDSTTGIDAPALEGPFVITKQ